MDNYDDALEMTKEAHKDVVAFLIKNQNRKVSTVLADVLAMTKRKAQTKASICDASGKVFAVFCYYHKQFELVSETEYGVKKSNTTGLNTMCKIGTSLWTKQNNAIKQIGSQILTEIEAGKLKPEDISDRKAKLKSKAEQIDETNMPNGYSLEEVLELLK